MSQELNIEIITQNENSVRFRIKEGDQNLSFKEVFKRWSCQPNFIKYYKDELIKFGFQAFYWEHPAIKKGFIDKKYECILQKSDRLEHLPCNEMAFKKYIQTNGPVVDFFNLGKDARLVVPTKKTDEEIYNHLGKVIRNAKDKQIIEIFKRVGVSMMEELENENLIWLNTAGLGVIWLHIRLDSKPKYYKTRMYKEPNFLNNNE